MTGIFARKSDGYADVPLLAGEQMVRQQTASYVVNGLPVWGGQLVLTNQRLLFRPLDLKAMTKMVQDGIDFLPDNLAVLGKVVNKVLDHSTAYQDSKAGAINTSAITGVRAGMNAAWTHPPTLILSLPGGQTLEIGILMSIGKPNIWPGNNAARDETVAAINAQLASNGLA